MDFTFKIKKDEKDPKILIPIDVMGIDKETGMQVWIIVTHKPSGGFLAEAQKFGLSVNGKDTKDLFAAFESAFNKKYKTKSITSPHDTSSQSQNDSAPKG